MAQPAPYEIFSDYTIPFLGETALSTILAGVVECSLFWACLCHGSRLQKKPEIDN